MSLTTWESVNWDLVRTRVSRYQHRIYKAAANKETKKVRILQERLLGSLDAKLLAVFRVTTENKGKNTSGVDRILCDTPAKKIELLKNLRLDGKALPIRRVLIPKPGKAEKRPLGIPVIADRAKQALCLLALDPEWESYFDSNSYGFRKGRSCHDAIEAIFSALRNHRKVGTNSKFVLDADIKSCFDQIDHDYLLAKLNTLPIIQKQISSWLKAGIMTDYANTPNDYINITNSKGTPQGGVISPLLANIALHGLQDHLNSWIVTKPIPYTSRGDANKIKALSYIRYADDFVIIHPNKQVILEAKEVCRDWLFKNPKLTLSDEKTKVVCSSNGFDFLGFTIVTVTRNNRERIKIYPSKGSQDRLISMVRNVIQKNKSSSTFNLINLLRPKIIGWGNYYRYSECQDVFSSLSFKIYGQLRAWVFRRDRRNSKTEIKDRYFPSGREFNFDGSKYKDNWVLVGQTKSSDGKTLENYLPHLKWIKSKKWVKVKGDYSIYNGDNTYWAYRSIHYGNWSIRERTLIKKQKGCCAYCNKSFINLEVTQVDHITPLSMGGKDEYKNLQLLHVSCHIRKTKSDGSRFKNLRIQQKLE